MRAARQHALPIIGGEAISEQTPRYSREHGPLELPIRVLRLEDQIRMLEREPAWDHGSRVARTLIKEGRLRVVLTLLHAGTKLDEHQAAGAITIQCLQGRLQVTSLGRSIELIEGELIALDGGVTHAVEAANESAFLLTMAE